MVEVVGTSNTSFSDAVRAAVRRAGETLEDITWFEVVEFRGRVSGDQVEEFQAKVNLGFRLHAAKDSTPTRANTRKGPTSEARSAAAQRATGGTKSRTRKAGARGGA